jgi:antitoxin component YwqK of YwqJK toxin-antitoxin module
MKIYFLGFILILLVGCTHDKIETKYISGKIMEAYTVNKAGERDGVYTSYYESGKIKEQCIFSKGKLTGQRTLYFDNGNKEIEENYNDDGLLQGLYKTYYRSGALHVEKFYQNNVLSGILKVYYPSGRLKEEVTLDNNVENGPFTEYYENGKVHWKGTYRNGDNEYGILYEYDSLSAVVKIMKCDTMAICRTIWKPGMPSINIDTVKI